MPHEDIKNNKFLFIISSSVSFFLDAFAFAFLAYSFILTEKESGEKKGFSKLNSHEIETRSKRTDIKSLLI